MDAIAIGETLLGNQAKYADEIACDDGRTVQTHLDEVERDWTKVATLTHTSDGNMQTFTLPSFDDCSEFKIIVSGICNGGHPSVVIVVNETVLVSLINGSQNVSLEYNIPFSFKYLTDYAISGGQTVKIWRNDSLGNNVTIDFYGR